MQIKVKVGTGENAWIGFLGKCNMQSINEYIVYSDEDVDSVPYSEITEFLINGVWYSKQEVEEQRLLINDNYNTCLDIPHSEAERMQGYNNY